MIVGEVMRDELSNSMSNEMRFPMIQEGRKAFEYSLWDNIKVELGISVMDSTPRVTKIFNEYDIWKRKYK